MRIAKAAIAAGCLCMLAGCGSVPRDAGFGTVEKLVYEGIGQRAVWNRDTDADAAVAESIQALLAKEMTADAAVQVALLNNRSLQATYEELGVAQADLVEAGLLQNPVFYGEIRFPARPAIPWEADIVQNFLDLFVLPLRKRMADAELERAKYHVASAVLDHAAQVRSAFYSLQGAEQLHEMRATTTEATEASAELANRQRQAKNISELDRSSEQALHEQALIELALAEADVLAQRERLNGLMGVWGADADRWRIASRLPGLPEPEVSPADLVSLAIGQRAGARTVSAVRSGCAGRGLSIPSRTVSRAGPACSPTAASDRPSGCRPWRVCD
ncbi:MAG: TolC family protein [Phycisphaerales bacterium]|nr:TolC family protein [Phycisphaerales bacterium]